MKAMKKVLAFVLALAMVVTAAPVTNAAAKTANLSAGKTVNKSYYAGKTHTLKLTGVTKADAKSTTWKSSNAKVVKIVADSQTKVSAQFKCVKKGTATVTATVTLKNGKTKTYKAKITVKAPKVTVSPSQVSVEVGKTVALTVKQAPSKANAKVVFTTDNASIATVDSTGVITGVKAGTAKITATLTCGTVKKTSSVAVTVKEAEITKPVLTDLVLKAENTLVATFSAPVNADKTKFSLKRGTEEVKHKIAWDADKMVATITTDAQMVKGIYEFSASGDDAVAATGSKTVEVQERHPVEIKILNDIALTNDTAKEAYVYYDVIDQYGKSMRSSISIDWNSSGNITKRNTTAGMLTITRNDATTKEFMYGEQLLVVGVYAKSGLHVNKTLTIGQKQAVNSIEIPSATGAFVKKGTTTALTALPKDFKDGQYYMLFNALDQNGCPMETGSFAEGQAIDNITFVSGNPLIISEMKIAGPVITIGDKEYDTVLVKPGIKVEDGGEVSIEAIANRTGNKTQFIVPVNMSSVIKSFVMNTSVTVADGDSVDIPFTAIGTDDKPITSFQTIAKQAQFNKLQLNASEGNLKLEEQKDGTAKLTYSDKAMPWSDSQTTDGMDRMVSLTAIVIGGQTDNQMLYIRDKRRPVAISKVGFHSAYVAGDTETLSLRNRANSDPTDAEITYVDQYGKEFTDWNKNDLIKAFFEASAKGQLKGMDFDKYVFGVLIDDNAAKTEMDGGVVTQKGVFLYADADATTLTMSKAVKGASTGENFKFAVAKVERAKLNTALSGVQAAQAELAAAKAHNDEVQAEWVASGYNGSLPGLWDKVQNAAARLSAAEAAAAAAVKNAPTQGLEYTTVDRAKTFGYSVLNISEVKSITVDNIDKIYVKTSNSELDYLTATAVSGASIIGIPSWQYNRKVKIKGSYAGKNDITIPMDYIASVAGKYVYSGWSAFDGWGLNVNVPEIQKVTSALTIDKFYTKIGTTDNFARKDLEDIVEVKIVKKYDDTGAVVTTPGVFTTVRKPVVISDEAPKATTLVANAGESTNRPDGTELKLGKGGCTVNDNGWQAMFALKDQYGVDASGITYEVKDIKEAEGYVDNNFVVSGNSTETVIITGAERGDTFTLVATCGKLTAFIKITVGADKKSFINVSGNSYLNDLVGNYLEPQRVSSLQ